MDSKFMNTSPGGSVMPLLTVLSQCLSILEGNNDIDCVELEEQLRYWISFESPL